METGGEGSEGAPGVRAPPSLPARGLRSLHAVGGPDRQRPGPVVVLLAERIDAPFVVGKGGFDFCPIDTLRWRRP